MDILEIGVSKRARINLLAKGVTKKVMKACVVNPTLGMFQSLEEADKVCTAVGAEWCAGIHDDECDGGASASNSVRSHQSH